MEFKDDVQDTVDKSVPLTEFSLQEETTIAPQAEGLPWVDLNSYVEQTPKQLLEREYLIRLLTVTVPSTAASVTPILGLISSGRAWDLALGSFRFIRWKAIEYRVLTACSPMLYGFIGWTGCPLDDRRDSTNPSLDYGWLSHEDTVLQDITSMPEIKLQIPWNFNTPWFDRSVSVTDSLVANLTSLKMINMNHLYQLDTAGPTHFDVQVFARFIEPEVAGPVVPDDFPSTYQAQSGVGPPAWLDRGPGGGTLSTLSLAGAAGFMGLNVAASNAAGWLVNKAFERGAKVVETKMASAVETTTNNASDVIPNVFGGMVVSPSKNLLGDGSMQGLFRYQENNILRFLQIPSLMQIIQVSAPGTFHFTSIADIAMVGDTAASCCRMNFLSQYFRFWRGSIRSTFVFFSSPFVTWRGRISTQTLTGTSPIVPGDVPAKTFTVRGSTKESITIPWVYPFSWQDCLSNEIHADFSQDYCVTLDSVSGYGTTNPNLVILHYRSAGDDFQFASQCEPGPNLTPGVYEAQMRIADFHKSTDFAEAGPNILHPAECSQTFEAMVRRWSGRGTPTTDLDPHYYAGPTDPSLGTFDSLACLFYYWRGQVKFKLLIGSVDITTENQYEIFIKMDNFKSAVAGGLQDFLRAADGMAGVSLTLSEVIEFTAPFLCNQEFVATNYGRISPVSTVLLSPSIYGYTTNLDAGFSPDIGGMYVAAGDDYCYFMMLPPPRPVKRWYLPRKPNLVDELRGKFRRPFASRCALICGPRPRLEDKTLNTVAEKLEEAKRSGKHKPRSKTVLSNCATSTA